MAILITITIIIDTISLRALAAERRSAAEEYQRNAGHRSLLMTAVF